MSQELPIYAAYIEEVYKAVGTSADGLTSAEAEARLKKFGPNAIQTIKGTPLWKKFLANFTHLLAILLWVGGIVAFLALIPLALRGVRYRPSGVSAISCFFH